MKSTQWRIFMFSVSESLLMVGMSAFQVWGKLKNIQAKVDEMLILLYSISGTTILQWR